MAKDERLHFRLDPAARTKLRRACALTGLDEAGALRACIQAFTDYVEEHGGIWLPLAILPKSEIAKPFGAAGEKPNAPADGPSTPSTPRFSTDALRLKEDPSATGPRARPTRATIKKLVGREKGKSAS